MMASPLRKMSNRSLLHIKICIYFLEKLLEKDSRFILPILWCCLLHGVSGAAAEKVSLSVKEGDSVTLQNDVKINQQGRLRWYFNNIRIAQVNGNLSNICTDVQCNEGTERFRGRLKLDNQTGSLTIMNIRTTDTGDYHLRISKGNNSDGEKTFSVTVHGFFSVGTNGVSVFLMERDSVTFQTDVETNQQGRIRWYLKDIRIAQITGDLSNICTDVQCNNGTERFRGRLKLDHQTGSLTITNITNTDAGVYQLRISSKNVDKIDMTFCFAVHNVSAAEQDEVKKEGENMTLYTDVIKNPNVVITWFFNDQQKVCTDDQCDERFRDRLKLDHQTGSLTIMNITQTDSGDYQLQINSSRVSIVRNFTLTVPVATVRNPGPPSTAAGANIAVIIIGCAVGGILLIGAVVVVTYCGHKRCTKNPQNGNTGQNSHDEENGETERFLSVPNGIQMNDVNQRTTDHRNQ